MLWNSFAGVTCKFSYRNLTGPKQTPPDECSWQFYDTAAVLQNVRLDLEYPPYF